MPKCVCGGGGGGGGGHKQLSGTVLVWDPFLLFFNHVELEGWGRGLNKYSPLYRDDTNRSTLSLGAQKFQAHNFPMLCPPAPPHPCRSRVKAPITGTLSKIRVCVIIPLDFSWVQPLYGGPNICI